MWSVRGFFSIKRFTEGKTYTSCVNFNQNWSASLLEKKVSSSVNDDDHVPSGGVLRKTNSIFIERKDVILLRCIQILKYFSALGNIYLTKI